VRPSCTVPLVRSFFPLGQIRHYHAFAGNVMRPPQKEGSESVDEEAR
jgi:hypothetical protein